MAESTPTGPISRVQDNEEVPALPVAAGYLAFGRTAGGIARPIEVDNNGAVVTTGSLTPSSVLTELPLEIATMGDNTIIAAPGVGNRIIIYHINYLTRGAVNVRLLSGANDLSGLYTWQNAQGGGFAFDGSSVGGLPLNENEAFVINLSAAVGIDGFILYSIAGVAPAPPGGVPDLENVLLSGNITGGSDIELSAGDELTSAAVGATDNGNPTTIRGGPGGATSGNGGAVALVGGTPVEGDGGNVTLTGANGVGTNQDGGDIILAAGSATGSGTPGDITFAARGSGAIPFNEAGNTTLSGFTATSIVGALNELNSGGSGEPLQVQAYLTPIVGPSVSTPVDFSMSKLGFGQVTQVSSGVSSSYSIPTFLTGGVEVVLNPSDGNKTWRLTAPFTFPVGFTSWGLSGVQFLYTVGSWAAGTGATDFNITIRITTSAGSVEATHTVAYPLTTLDTVEISQANLNTLAAAAGDPGYFDIIVTVTTGAPPGYQATCNLRRYTLDFGTS